MNKIEFKNFPDLTTPLNATNLNQLQTNVENAINENNWVNITLQNDFIQYSGQNVPQYRIIGKCMYLRGVIKTSQNITTSNRTITTLPYSINSLTTNMYFPCAMNGSTRTLQQIQFAKTGELLAPTAMTTSDWIALDGIVIVLD